MKKNKFKIIVILLTITSLITTSSLTAENMDYNRQSCSNISPDLSYFPTSHNFGYVEEGERYYTGFEIWNGGNETLTWNLTSNQSWIFFYPRNGTSTGEHDTITVSIDTTDLLPGPHSSFISISCNDSIGYYKFNITFIINEPPETPSRPIGPSTGVVGSYYSYYTSTVDPEGNLIRYGLDSNSDDIIDYWSDTYYPSGETYTTNIQFNSAKTYYLRFKAKDEHGAQSNFSLIKTVVISGENQAPGTPTTPTGPTIGDVDTSYSFTTSSYDADEDTIKYGWDWNGDNVIDEWTGFYESGILVTRSHRYVSSGTYFIRVVAEDEKGAQSNFSSSATIIITGNTAPNKPATPSGITTGRAGISYSYSSSTSDPQDDNIYYLFDWGDGTNSGWIGPYTSGSGIAISHTWFIIGSFAVKVKAKDDPNKDGNLTDGSESVWSNALPVQMPKNKAVHYPLLQFFTRIMERYPIIGQLIQQ